MKGAVLPPHIQFPHSYVDSSGPMNGFSAQLVLSLTSRCTITSVKTRMEGIGLTFSAYRAGSGQRAVPVEPQTAVSPC